MTGRHLRLVGLLGIVLVIGLVSAVFFLGQTDGCMSGNDSSSCPALADVNGVRYSVSVGLDLKNIEPNLSPYAAIARSNWRDQFAEMQAYSVAGFDPAVLLIGRAAVGPTDEGSYRMMLVLRGDRDSIWPQFCPYLSSERLAAQPECSARATT